MWRVDGTGFSKHIACGGHGFTPCLACSSSGRVSCSNCAGSGVSQCDTCGGSGTRAIQYNCGHGFGPNRTHYYCSVHGNSVSQYH